MHTTTGGLTEFETREDEKEYELQRAEPGHRMLTTKQIDAHRGQQGRAREKPREVIDQNGCLPRERRESKLLHYRFERERKGPTEGSNPGAANSTSY